MFDTAAKTFLDALRRMAERRLGRGHPCCQAVEQAAREGDPGATQAAQKALDELPPDVLAALMADTHKALRGDPIAILARWGSGPARH